MLSIRWFDIQFMYYTSQKGYSYKEFLLDTTNFPKFVDLELAKARNNPNILQITIELKPKYLSIGSIEPNRRDICYDRLRLIKMKRNKIGENTQILYEDKIKAY